MFSCIPSNTSILWLFWCYLFLFRQITAFVLTDFQRRGHWQKLTIRRVQGRSSAGIEMLLNYTGKKCYTKLWLIQQIMYTGNMNIPAMYRMVVISLELFLLKLYHVQHTVDQWMRSYIPKYYIFTLEIIIIPCWVFERQDSACERVTIGSIWDL